MQFSNENFAFKLLLFYSVFHTFNGLDITASKRLLTTKHISTIIINIILISIAN